MVLENYKYFPKIGKSRLIDDLLFVTSKYEADVHDDHKPIARICGEVIPAELETIWLHHLKVDTNYREQGIGTELLSNFIVWAKTTPSSQILLNINVGEDENCSAIQNWYVGHFGFTYIGLSEQNNPELLLKFK